ncbi:carbohydate-binding domain-containing protein [Shewanella algae]|uniref:family 20 glycosylhydrolase n=1 Tax=Shewanella algae TaxID=38313 RepID=UPI001AADE1C0|nr:family 20 glycosylhydrolase [Shewanella algae]MBO2682712.1 carbohydate-binding domain-containing protein [Shewanella algae]MCM2530234.1 carbohydate-binding domain-containing protein [Shewanella algae]
MKLTIAALAIALSLGLTACSDKPPATGTEPGQSQAGSSSKASNEELTQNKLHSFAQSLQLKYAVLSNVPDDNCDPSRAEGRCFQAQIRLTPSEDLSASDWAIYFSQMRPVLSVASPEFHIEHIQGDLHRLTPTAAFGGFKKGVSEIINFRGELWQLSEIDAMPNYYMVVEGLKPEVIASTEVKQDPDTGLELLPYVQPYTDAEKQYRRSSQDKLPWDTASVVFGQNADTPDDAGLAVASLIPKPDSVTWLEQTPVTLNAGIKLNPSHIATGVELQSLEAALLRLQRLGVSQSEQGLALNLLPFEGGQSEHYRLEIEAGGINLAAADAAGYSYGLASLAALLQLPADDTQSIALPQLRIQDGPRYPFRGMHLDVGRNFHSKAFVLSLLEQMAAYKLNVLHLHMADDEGWRLQIPGLPELTEIGSKRCHDLDENRCLLPQLGSGPNPETQVNGYYTTQDYIDILKFAAARQIQVIPSMDMPGHSRAAIKSMQARSRKLLAQGDSQAASQYLLADPEDATVYSSIQYYNDNTLNVCMESSYTFVAKVIDEIAQLHQAAGVPLKRYHIGADETAGAWLDSPACERFIAANSQRVADKSALGAYFIERVSQMLAERGIEAAGWSDGMSHVNPANMPSPVQSNIWDIVAHGGFKRAHAQANLGWDTVLSNPEVLYFDMPPAADPKEPGYYWASRSSNSRKLHSFMPDNLPANAEQWGDIEARPFVADDTEQLSPQGKRLSGPMAPGRGFIGLQGQLWSETIRSDTTAAYMIFPRLLVLAEKAWHKPDWELAYRHQGASYSQDSGYFGAEQRKAQAEDWHRLANILGHKELAKLDKAGVHYRLPLPGGRIKDGKLEANIIFPGLKIQYRRPGAEWQEYRGPVAIAAPLELRSVSPDGRRYSRVQPLN